MDKTRCAICGWYNVDRLCKHHKSKYMWDSSIQCYRLKKRHRGSRYTNADFHHSEIVLTQIIEKYYGFNDVFTSTHPIWAKSHKNVLYEFDIYIKSKDTFIEYNSNIHYEFTPFFHKTYTKFIEQQQRDIHKKKLVKQHKRLLITITEQDPLFKDYIINKITREHERFNSQ